MYNTVEYSGPVVVSQVVNTDLMITSPAKQFISPPYISVGDVAGDGSEGGRGVVSTLLLSELGG